MQQGSGNGDSAQEGSGLDTGLAEGLAQVQRVFSEASTLILDLLEARRLEASEVEAALQAGGRDFKRPSDPLVALPPEPAELPMPPVEPPPAFLDSIDEEQKQRLTLRAAAREHVAHRIIECKGVPDHRQLSLRKSASEGDIPGEVQVAELDRPALPRCSPVAEHTEADHDCDELLHQLPNHNRTVRAAARSSLKPSHQSVDSPTGRKTTQFQVPDAEPEIQAQDSLQSGAATTISDCFVESSSSAGCVSQTMRASRRRQMGRLSNAIKRGQHTGAMHPSRGMRDGAAGATKRACFIDGDKIKANIRSNMVMDVHAVESSFYCKTGCAQAMAKNQYFESLTLFVIFLNMVWIAIEIDLNTQDVLWSADPWVQCGENLFCMYFTIELAIRFAAFKLKRDTVKDLWFVMDATLVFLMVFETWVLSLVIFLFMQDASNSSMGKGTGLRILRLLRLARLGRLGRLLRRMPELLILVKGILVATRSVLCTLCLLFLVIYIFALIFRLCSKGTAMEQDGFHNVPQTMLTLLVGGTLPDLEEIVARLSRYGWIYPALLLIFVLLSSLTVMNMLVGVLVEVVQVVSSVEKEQMEVDFVRTQLQELLPSVDVDNDFAICKDEFVSLIENPVAIRCLTNISVDVVGLVDYVDVIFGCTEELTFEEFMETLLSLRGSQKATVRDIVDLRKVLVQEMTNLETRISTKKKGRFEDERPMKPGMASMPSNLSNYRGSTFGQSRSSTGISRDTSKSETDTAELCDAPAPKPARVAHLVNSIRKAVPRIF